MSGPAYDGDGGTYGHGPCDEDTCRKDSPNDGSPGAPGRTTGPAAGPATDGGTGTRDEAPRETIRPETPAAPSRTRPVASLSERLPQYEHGTLKSLLGAWALSACPRDEALAVEVHLTDCATCAEEALRLRRAVALLHQEEPLDLDPLLRARVLEGCLGRRPARIPVPEWAGPYDAEAARLDALLRDLGDGYWKTPVRLQWFDGAPVVREFTVAQVIAHLTAVDSLVARSLGLPARGSGRRDGDAPNDSNDSHDPAAATGPRTADGPAALGPRDRPEDGPGPGGFRLGGGRPPADLPVDPQDRTAAHWAMSRHLPGATVRSLWREQGHHLVRTVSFAGQGVSGLDVDYGSFSLPLREAFLDRAFECWIHAADIAEAVDYPYEPPAPGHLNRMIELAARLLPTALAERRRAGLTASGTRLGAVGEPGRSLRLEIEGTGGGTWLLPLDSPGAVASEERTVAHVAMDSLEFCQLAAGHVEPERTAAGMVGDAAAIRDVLFATASLSRL